MLVNVGIDFFKHIFLVQIRTVSASIDSSTNIVINDNIGSHTERGACII